MLRSALASPGAAAEVLGQGGSAPVTGGSPSAGWLRPPLPAAGAGSSGVGLRTQASVGRMAYGGSVMRGLVCVFVCALLCCVVADVAGVGGAASRAGVHVPQTVVLGQTLTQQGSLSASVWAASVQQGPLSPCMRGTSEPGGNSTAGEALTRQGSLSPGAPALVALPRSGSLSLSVERALVQQGPLSACVCWAVAQRQLQLYAEDRQLLASDGSDVFTSLSAADGTTVSIVVESCQLGVNPGDVHQCTALFEGLAEAGTLFSIQSVPCYTPTFSCGGSYLRWEVTCAPPPDVAVGDCSAEPEPQPEEFVSLPRVEMVGVARLLEVGERWSEARGFPLTTVVKLDGVGLTRDVWQSTRRQCERTSADRDFGAQLDAWTSGLGCWEACGLDDDDDMDELDAWRDSEALDYWDA